MTYEKTVKEANGSKFEIWRCPNGDRCKSYKDGVRRGVKTGWSNVVSHLKTCYNKTPTNAPLSANCAIYQLYHEKKGAKTKQSTIESFVGSTKEQSVVTDFDRELFDWIEMIVMENWPLSVVENLRYHEKLGHNNKFSIKTVSSMLLGMTLSVEKVIAAEMQSAGYGSIIHDGWTKFWVHYFGIFATYMSEKSTKMRH